MSIVRIESNHRLSQAVVHGGLVYLTGQAGDEGADVEAQTRYVLSQIDRLLAKAGSDKSKILSATILLADVAEFPLMNTVWDAWVDQANPPARATLEARMVKPEYRVEIIVVAAT
ncbi:MAG TPA: RidA family protein [Caulobacteraceae bacterium]|jgi:enamine deaminase RidA (YjgF/YER057c/UK114 family)